MEKIVIVLTGPPCSGKTTLCQRYLSNHKAIYFKLDDVVFNLSKRYKWNSPYTDEQIDSAVKVLYQEAKKKSGKILLEIAYHDINNLKAIAERIGLFIDVLFFVRADEKILLERNNMRNKKDRIPENYIIRCLQRDIEENPGFPHFAVIDTMSSYEASFNKLCEVIENAKQQGKTTY